ncbi:STAS domain-containing protein [Tepidibacter thalassicus]|uniref:Anti-sigma factor antagonist n=1 Tax=Tepidibacter thalassicus DSM 15285 TaxID=1123350 RepID=A0A1M5PL49_9FIRM|nr:STAS domain-containing protein [Tepidibacter thalassicus]SHH02498.1 anti-sigma B factor antagonist [Tepidibacter thalassicus DSM 15285]
MSEVSILIPENFAVEEASEFRQRVNDLMNEGKKNFTLNFRNCTFIDSTGLGVLVGIYKKCKEVNGRLTLHSMNPNVMKVFELTRLDKVFEIDV